MLGNGLQMNILDITSGPVASPAELIDIQESLSAISHAQPPTSASFAFRGQSQSYGTLVPSFQRIFGQKRWVGAAEIIERDLIKTFRKHYAELKGRTDDMPRPVSIDSGYDLRCLSVMQHYGVPTRLLDWTSDFWTAIYFACAGDPSKEAELWLYDRSIFLFGPSEFQSLYFYNVAGQPLPPREPDILSQRGGELIVELDPQITPRMREQFAHHTLSSDVFADHGPLLFDLAAKPGIGINAVQSTPSAPDEAQGAKPETRINSRFRRLLIAPGCKEKTLRFLEEQKQVTAGTIFPDVEGLGKFLHWHLESLVTTLL